METIKMGSICFERTTKELVKISNGIDAGGVFAPTEAVALRVAGYKEFGCGPQALVAIIYRGVEPENLTLVSDETRDAFEGALSCARPAVKGDEHASRSHDCGVSVWY